MKLDYFSTKLVDSNGEEHEFYYRETSIGDVLYGEGRKVEFFQEEREEWVRTCLFESKKLIKYPVALFWVRGSLSDSTLTDEYWRRNISKAFEEYMIEAKRNIQIANRKAEIERGTLLPDKIQL